MALTSPALPAQLARFATVTLTALLAACAAGPANLDDEPAQYSLFDAAVDPSLPADSSAPPYDSGTASPGDASAPIRPVDAGSARDASSGSDASSAQLDASTPSAAVDSGAPRPSDAAADTSTPKADAGTDSGSATNGQVCATTPSYPTATSCAQCTCTKCATQVATGYASSDSTKNAQCASVRACAETNHCVGNDCYCGDSVLCLNPSGPCRSVIESAAGATEPLDVQRVADDANSGLGRAKAIGDCQMNNCRSECGL